MDISNKIYLVKKENEELKNINRMSLYSKLSDQLAEAIDIIQLLLICFPYDMTDDEYDIGSHDVVRKAEQFLKKVK